MNDLARFHFGNLCADAARLAAAAEAGNGERYLRLKPMARHTLASLRAAGDPAAYEEGLLLLRALELAREDGTLALFAAWLARVTPQAV